VVLVCRERKKKRKIGFSGLAEERENNGGFNYAIMGLREEKE